MTQTTLADEDFKDNLEHNMILGSSRRIRYTAKHEQKKTKLGANYVLQPAMWQSPLFTTEGTVKIQSQSRLNAMRLLRTAHVSEAETVIPAFSLSGESNADCSRDCQTGDGHQKSEHVAGSRLRELAFQYAFADVVRKLRIRNTSCHLQ